MKSNRTLDDFPRDAQGRMILPEKVLRRFWAKVDRSGGDDACWLWLGSKHGFGYGHFSIFNHPWSTHRISYLIHHGRIPVDREVLHSCNVAACINPCHLRLGTRQENSLQMWAEGRHSGTPPPQFKRSQLPHPTIEERFWAKVDKSGDCWIWTAGRNAQWGYATFTVNNKSVGACHWAYSHFVGPVPDGMLVCHRCGNGHLGCVRLDHLYLGTPKQNTHDMMEMGRRYQPVSHGITHPGIFAGTGNPRAKLDEEMVEEILALHAQGLGAWRISKRYPVHLSSIKRILNGKGWKNVPRDGEPKPSASDM